MNPVTLHEASSIAAAWPLVLVGLAVAGLVGRLLLTGGRPALDPTSAAGTGIDPTCRAVGHHYVRDADGWCCSHCGDEIRYGVAAGTAAHSAA